MPLCKSLTCNYMLNDNCKYCPECGRKVISKEGPSKCLSILEDGTICMGQIEPSQKFCTECGSAQPSASNSGSSSDTSHFSSSLSEASTSGSSTSTEPQFIFITDPNYAHKFRTNDINFPGHLLNKLKSEKPLKPTDRKKVVRLVMDHILSLCSHPTKNELEVVALKLTASFPASLQEELYGTVIGSGCQGFVEQLVHRRDNVNRSGQLRQLKRVYSENAEKEPPKKKPKDSYGCINWGPKVEDMEKESHARDQLKNLFDSSMHTPKDVESMVELQKASYALLRQEINEGKSVAMIKEQWPFLCTQEGMQSHYLDLVGSDPVTVFTLNMERKGTKLLRYFKGQNQSNMKNIVSKIEDANAAAKNCKADGPGLLLLLSAYFKDDAVLKNVDVTLTEKEIKDKVEEVHPILIFCGESTVKGTGPFHIFAEKVKVASCGDFIIAFALLFATFYIFNLEYPDSASSTFIFLQRFFFDINTGGSKVKTSKKKISSIPPKVMKLVQDIKNFETDEWN